MEEKTLKNEPLLNKIFDTLQCFIPKRIKGMKAGIYFYKDEEMIPENKMRNKDLTGYKSDYFLATDDKISKIDKKGIVEAFIGSPLPETEDKDGNVVSATIDKKYYEAALLLADAIKTHTDQNHRIKIHKELNLLVRPYKEENEKKK